MTFNAKAYWENRLGEDYNLHGVGFKGLGEGFNHWMYKVRDQVFYRLIKHLKIDAKNSSVLDVGCGTGFYVERWLNLDVKNLNGIDITEIAVNKLSERFPEIEFRVANIGEKMENNFNAPYNVITAYDVLFHIVDNNNWKQALNNIHSMLDENGYFIFSDNFLHNCEIRLEHIVSRTLEDYEQALDEAGFEIVKRVPMFVLMNQPVDCKNPLMQLVWKLVTAPARFGDKVSMITTRFIYYLEMQLVTRLSESPTTEIMVCRKKK